MMTANMDVLFARFVRESMEKNLGRKTTKKIENELHSWYQIDLEQAMTQFDKLDRVLVNIYGRSAANALEKKFVKPVMEKDQKASSKNTVTITLNDPQLAYQVFDIMRDDMNRIILQILKDTPMPICQLIKHPELEKYSDKTVYKKMCEISKTGLIIVADYMQSPDNKRVKIYRSILDGVDLRIDGNNMDVSITIPKEIAYSSIMLSTVFA